jgi:hypothetical protein
MAWGKKGVLLLGESRLLTSLQYCVVDFATAKNGMQWFKQSPFIVVAAFASAQNCVVAEPPRTCDEDEEPHFNVTLPAPKRSTQYLSVLNMLYEVQNDTFTFLLDLRDPSKLENSKASLHKDSTAPITCPGSPIFLLLSVPLHGILAR